MQKCTHREVRILLGGIARLVGFFRTLLGFKVAIIHPKTDWLEMNFSFKVDYYQEDSSTPARGRNSLPVMFHPTVLKSAKKGGK